jgi:hypothetical protein
MSEPVRILLVVVIVGVIVGFTRSGSTAPRPAPAPVQPEEFEPLPGPLRFAPDVSEGNRQVVLRVIAAARPEAQRLIDAVDGMVEVHVGATGRGGALGYAQTRGPQDFKLQLDLDQTYASTGLPGVARMVLHEFGHVVDAALIDEALNEQLDAGIPRGYQCDEDQPTTGSCANRLERFAETFAKWAMNDIGADIYAGYKIPPPSMPLDDWGRPLAGLAL